MRRAIARWILTDWILRWILLLVIRNKYFFLIGKLNRFKYICPANDVCHNYIHLDLWRSTVSHNCRYPWLLSITAIDAFILTRLPVSSGKSQIHLSDLIIITKFTPNLSIYLPHLLALPMNILMWMLKIRTMWKDQT